MKRNQNSISADKLKGVLITRTAIKTLIPEDIVEKVIMFQFKDFKSMIHIHEQVEISGFCKFMTSPNKLKKKIERLEAVIAYYTSKYNEESEEIKKDRYLKAIEEITDTVTYLKSRKGGV